VLSLESFQGQRRHQPAGIEEQDALIIPSHLRVSGAEIISMTNGVGDGFAQGVQRVFPNDLPGWFADKLKLSLKMLAEVAHRAVHLSKERTIDFTIIHNESGRAEAPDFDDG
jgi:hypothetical protein